MRAFFVGLLILGGGDEPGLSPHTLKDLPHVVRVEVSVRPDRPTFRLIHILNWHILPKDLFAADVRDLADQPLSDDEIDRQYDEHLREVERVQDEQVELLRHLIQKHGLRRVFCEGLATDDMRQFHKSIKILRKFAKNKPSGDSPIEQLILAQYRKDLLEIGSAGRLLLTGELKSIGAVEDKKLLEKANPLRQDGRVVLDQAVIEARENVIVKNVLSGSGVALLIMGGGHDLSDNVPAGCEYVRVTTEQYRRIIAGEKLP